jgi:YVTN family beta-propeller protein
MLQVAIITSNHRFLFIFPFGITILLSALLVGCSNVKAQTIESIIEARKSLETGPQIMVGNFPEDIYINPVTNKIYVANTLSSSVSIIDSNSGNVKTVRVGTTPLPITR